MKKNKIFNKFSYRCDCIEGKKWIEEEWNKCRNNGAVLIDVRSRQEFEEGHIDGAILIPYYELKLKVKEKVKDLDTLILLYCNTGNRSMKALKILNKMGYTNVKQMCK